MSFQLKLSNAKRNGEKLCICFRLSKVAYLTYYNPNIADLTDENRPTKLAEKFSELFDNEWTDVFEELDFETEKGKIHFLYDILMKTNAICSDLSNGHTKRIKDAFCRLTTTRHNTVTSVVKRSRVEKKVIPTALQKGENFQSPNKRSNPNEEESKDSQSDEEQTGSTAVEFETDYGLATTKREVEDSDKDPEADKIKKDNSAVSKKNNDVKGDFEEGTSLHENGGNGAKEPKVEHSDKDTEADKIKKVNSVVSKTENNKQGDFEAGTSSNENKGNVAKNDNDEKGDFEEGTRSIENIGNVAKEPEYEHSDNDTKSDKNQKDNSVASKNMRCLQKDNDKQGNFEAGTSSNENKGNVAKNDNDGKGYFEEGTRSIENVGNVAKEISIESDFDLLSKEQKKTIMEAKNFFEIHLRNEVETTVTDLISKSLQMKMESRDLLETYIKKCVNICWLMCRHNPPVFIEFPDVKENIPFDTNKYKPYTRSGKYMYIDHIVWPALHLHEGGPLLCKGEAQGIGQKDCNKLCK